MNNKLSFKQFIFKPAVVVLLTIIMFNTFDYNSKHSRIENYKSPKSCQYKLVCISRDEPEEIIEYLKEQGYTYVGQVCNNGLNAAWILLKK